MKKPRTKRCDFLRDFAGKRWMSWKKEGEEWKEGVLTRTYKGAFVMTRGRAIGERENEERTRKRVNKKSHKKKQKEVFTK